MEKKCKILGLLILYEHRHMSFLYVNLCTFSKNLFSIYIKKILSQNSSKSKFLKTKFQLAETISCLRTTEVDIINYVLQMKNKKNVMPFNNRSTSTDQSKERL